MFKGDDGYYQYGDSHKTPWPDAKSIVANFVTAMLKGLDTDLYTLKGGDAQSGTLTPMWNSHRPKKTPAYFPKKLQGAIILGTGGDGSNSGTGTFFEGPSVATCRSRPRRCLPESDRRQGGRGARALARYRGSRRPSRSSMVWRATRFGSAGSRGESSAGRLPG